MNPVRPARIASVLGLAAAAGAALGLAQVAIAELADILTLRADFAAGNDRVQGVQVTLVAWYCAMAVPLAVTVAGRDLSARARAAVVLPAAVGTLVTWPLVSGLSSDLTRADAVTAVLTGVLLGVVGGAGVAVAPAVGKGLAVYVGLLWAAALVFTPLVPRTVVYAGMVQPLGLDFMDSVRPALSDLPYNLGYHLLTMLPAAAAILIAAGVLSGVTARRTGAWAGSVGAGAAGPVLAAIVYRLTPGQVYLWNESASVVVLALATCCLLIAIIVTAVCRRRSPTV